MHPHFWPFFFPSRYAEPEEMHAAVKAAAEKRVYGDWDLIDDLLGRQAWLVGKEPTAADALLLPMTRWGMKLERSTTQWANIAAHMKRVSDWQPAARAFEAQGLQRIG